MKIYFTKIIWICFFSANLVLLTNCKNWVQLLPEGAEVSLKSATDVSKCRRIGTTSAQTLSKLIVVERGAERLQTELLTLARNQAGRMNANTIVPESLIEEGKQRFGVYSCP